MRVAIFTETFLPQVNGVVRTIEKIIKHLEAAGHDVLVFTIGEGESIYSQTQIIRLEGIPFTLYKELHIVKPEDKWLSKLLENELTQTPVAALQTLLPSKNSIVEKALEDFKPDLIHLATPATLGAIGIYYIDQLKLPSLATFHTDIASYAPMYQIPYVEEIINTITKLVYSKVDRILAPSPSSKDQLEKIGLKNIGIFGRGVDSELFDPKKKNKSVLAQYGLDPELTTLTYVGRLAEEKSLPELVSAFNQIHPVTPAQLLLVGDGPARDKLEQILKSSQGRFAFTGIKKGEDLAALYASSDIFAFPSKTETFGQVVQEAMASGLPVVGYDSPGVRDLVEHNKSGLLSKSQEEFINNLKDLINNKDKASEFGQYARTLASQRSWINILDGLINEYSSLVK